MDVGSAKQRPPTLAAGQRIGDAERERAAACLSEHFAAGRIDHEEFEVRVGAAYAATTAADLEPLFLDLPRSAPAAPTTQTTQTTPDARRSRRPFVVPVLPLVLLAAGVATIVSDGRFPFFFVFPMLWFAGGWRRRRGW